jgi:putative nucleotidyltransferase with HDIG domain
METTMTPNEIIAKVKNLPTVSQAALKLACLLDQPAVSNEDIVTVLKYDDVLTAKLLRACNSPYFGFEEQISSVEESVLILGHQQILHMVLGLSFGGAMSANLPGYAIEARELWFHSVTTAVAAEHLAKGELPMDAKPPVAFTAGLLHDIGKLVLTQILDADAQSAIRSCIVQDHLPQNAAEKKILGTDHAEVGACLLKKWRLPDEIIEAVANHHHPATNPLPKLSAVIHVANSLVHLTGSILGWDCYAMLTDAKASEALGITPGQIEKLKMEIHDSAGKVERIIQLA